MSRVFDAVSGNSLTNANILSTTPYPHSMFIWFKTNPGILANVYAMNLTNAADDVVLSFQYRTDPQTRVFSNNSTASPAINVPVPVHDEWHSVVITSQEGASGIFGQIDTVSNSSGTVSARDISGTGNKFVIGANAFPAVTGVWDGKLAHCAVWDKILSPADITELMAGTPPDGLTSGTSGLVEYWPLTDSSLTGTVGAEVLTVTGTVPNDDADNPPVSGGPIAPAFSTNPVADTVTEPAPAGFGTVVASDTTSWQWEVETADGNNTWVNAETIFVGDTAGTELTDTLAIDPTAFGDTRRVRVVATGAGGSTISTPTTGAQLTVDAADGGDTDSRPITLSPPSDTIVINAMTTGADAAVITEGSVFDSNMIIVEPNMQASIKAQIAVTGGFADMTLEANGVYGFSYSGGAVDQAFDIDVTYYSPSTGQMSLATITTIPV